jgi:Spy/CpxP family protein refolding chaperone
VSGINEFNGIQPEQADNFEPDLKLGKKFLAGAVLVTLIVTGIAAFGFTMNIISKFKDDPYGVLIDKVASDINLNDQQKHEVNKIKDEVNAKLENRKIKHIKRGAEIEKLFRNDNFDRSAALTVANLQEKENRDIAVYMVDQLEKLHGLLTSEQRNNAVDKVKELYASYKSMKSR